MNYNWAYKKLGECYPIIKNGANIKQSDNADGIPITRIETLSGGVFNRDRMGYANVYDSTVYEDYILKDGDLLLSHINSKSFIGRTVEYKKLENEQIIHGMNLLRLRGNDGSLLSSFFAYYTQCKKFKADIARIRKDAVNQSSVSISDLRSILIPVPTIKEQESILSEYWHLKNMLQVKILQSNLLDELLCTIYFEMFNKTNAEAKTIGEVCLLKSGDSNAAKTGDGSLPYVKVSDMNLAGNEVFITYSSSYVKRDKNLKGIFPQGTVIFPKRGGAIATNKKRLVATDICCDLNTMGVIPGKDIHPSYLYQYFMNIDFGRLCNGSSVPQINNCDIAPLKIHVPSMEKQLLFAHKFDEIQQMKKQIAETKIKTEELLASRMQYWFD